MGDLFRGPWGERSLGGGRPAGPRAGTHPTTSSSTGLRTRWSGPPAGPAAGCSILPLGAGRRTAGWRGRSPFPFPGWACGSPRRLGPDLALLSAAAACSGGRLEVLGGIFSTGRADCLAGWGGGMPRYFRRGGAAASRGFGWFRMVSGPAFWASFPPRRRAWSGLPPGPFHRCCRGAAGRPPGRPENRSGGRLFGPFCPAFSGPEGAPETLGAVVFRRAAKNGPV